MTTFIVYPDGTTAQPHGGFSAEELGGRAIVAYSAEDARHIAYADGYARFPAMKHYDNTEPAQWTVLRDNRILAAARRVILAEGMRGLSRAAIAEAANMATGTVSNFGRTHYKQTGNPAEGYRARILAGLMSDAIDKGDIAMIRVGVADGCLRADEVPEGLRAVVGV